MPAGVVTALLFLFLSVTRINSAAVVDLSGEWKLKLVACLAGERVCPKKIGDVAKESHIALPSNLHSNFPWFYGEALFSRTIEYQPTAGVATPDLLLLGSIGSVDETRINGVLIGKEGHYTPGSIVSAWNKVRAYEVPPGVLRPGKNTIEVKVTVLDFKAGIHAGPLELTSTRSAQYDLLWFRILREYTYIAIPLLLLVVMIAFMTAITYWQKDDGNGFLVAAFFSYLVHSAYFIPLPWSIEYLTFDKIHWIGRIWSVMFSALYFAKNLGFYKWKRDSFWIFFGIVLSLLTVCASSLGDFADILFWIHIAFLTHLFYPLLFHRQIQNGPRRIIYRRYLPLSIFVLAIYLHDSFVIGYVINTPWIFHYISIMNVVEFIDHFSFHLYMWRDRGRLDAEIDHMRDKLHMAHELHDAVGADLSQMVVMSHQVESPEHRSNLSRLASGALEKVRDFAHILKGETSVESLPRILEMLCTRLRALRRYRVYYLENPVAVRLQPEQTETGFFEQEVDKSAIEKLKPFARLHIERILSEWTSNLIRHAQGTKTVVLGWQVKPRKARIFLFQDNAPFTWRGKAARGGLQSMEQRGREIRGQVTCRKRHGGALWLLVVPLAA